MRSKILDFLRKSMFGRIKMKQVVYEKSFNNKSWKCTCFEHFSRCSLPQPQSQHNCLPHRIIAKNKRCLNFSLFANCYLLMHCESVYDFKFFIFRSFLGFFALLKCILNWKMTAKSKANSTSIFKMAVISSFLIILPKFLECMLSKHWTLRKNDLNLVFRHSWWLFFSLKFER